MPDVTLPNMGLVQPSLGGSSGTWGTSINNNIGALDAHDHSTAKGVQVPVAGLDIDDDISFAGLHGPIHCFRVGFDEIAGVSIPPRSFYVKSSDHELYFKSTGLADIKLTSGGDLNLSGTGGFIGDYSGSGAKASFDTALNEFKFTSSANLRSQVQCGGVKLVERDANESFGVSLLCPAALGIGYAWTLPLALPGSTALAQVDAAGVVTTSNTIVNDLTMTANKHVIVSGTGAFKHGDVVLNIPGSAVGPNANVSVTSSGSAACSAGTTLWFPIPLKVGDRIKSVTFARFGDGAVDLTIDISTHDSSGTSTSIGSTAVTNAIAAWADTTVDVTDTVIAALQTVALSVVANAALAALDCIRVTYDRP